MAIAVRHMAKVDLQDETIRAMVLGMYSYESRYQETLYNYHYTRGGIAYLPPNYAKLEVVAGLLGEEIVDQRNSGSPIINPFELNPNFKLRPYQEKPTKDFIAHVLDKRMGTVHAGCGTGKTVVMTRAAGELGKRTLILVDQSNLKSNWVDAFDFIWGRKLNSLTSTTGKLEDCMITTFQLLARSPDTLNKVKNEYGSLLIDECQCLKATTFKQVMSQMDNKYRLSCTATFHCKAFDNGVLEDWTSPISVRMIDDGALIPNVIWHSTGVDWASNEPMDFTSITTPKLAKDHTRNAMILSVMKNCLERKRRTVVICISNEQALFLSGLARGLGGRGQVYTGTTTDKVDRKLKADMNNGELDFVFTCRKITKGTDLESLDTIIIANPNNNKNDTEQLSGRVRRKLIGKPDPEVHDFIDGGELALAFAKNRNRWYENVDGKGDNILNSEELEKAEAILIKKGLTRFRK